MKKTRKTTKKTGRRLARRESASGRIMYLDPMSDEFTAAMTDAFRKGVRAAITQRESSDDAVDTRPRVSRRAGRK